MGNLDHLWRLVVDYFNGDVRFVGHAELVLGYARRILGEYKANRTIVEAVAMVHDIGIPEAERKHGSAAGPFQEMEGQPIARGLLEEAGFSDIEITHVCKIVASHHSFGEMETPEFSVLWDSDWLVNLEHLMPGANSEQLAAKIDSVFQTPVGRKLAYEIYVGFDCPGTNET